MACKICGRSSCASWMHSIEEQEEYESKSEYSPSATETVNNALDEMEESDE